MVADPRFERTTAERTGYVPRSLLAVPLADEDGTLGVMEFLDRRDGVPFDLVDLETGGRFAAALTASIRATRLDHEAVGLFRATLAAVASGDPGSGTPVLDRSAVDELVAAVAERIDEGDPLWRLADRIGRLRQALPEDLDLAVDWLDALIAHERRRDTAGR